jgi:hypothetical protein
MHAKSFSRKKENDSSITCVPSAPISAGMPQDGAPVPGKAMQCNAVAHLTNAGHRWQETLDRLPWRGANLESIILINCGRN